MIMLIMMMMMVMKLMMVMMIRMIGMTLMPPVGPNQPHQCYNRSALLTCLAELGILESETRWFRPINLPRVFVAGHLLLFHDLICACSDLKWRAGSNWTWGGPSWQQFQHVHQETVHSPTLHRLFYGLLHHEWIVHSSVGIRVGPHFSSHHRQYLDLNPKSAYGLQYQHLYASQSSETSRAWGVIRRRSWPNSCCWFGTWWLALLNNCFSDLMFKFLLFSRLEHIKVRSATRWSIPSSKSSSVRMCEQSKFEGCNTKSLRRYGKQNGILQKVRLCMFGGFFSRFFTRWTAVTAKRASGQNSIAPAKASEWPKYPYHSIIK